MINSGDYLKLILWVDNNRDSYEELFEAAHYVENELVSKNLQDDPSWGQVKYLLASEIYDVPKFHAKAAKLAREALALGIDSTWILGEIAEASGDIDEAKEWYEAASENDPSYYTKLGALETDLGLQEKWYVRGWRAGNLDCMDNLGWISEKRGLVAAAKHWWQQTAELGSEYGKENLVRLENLELDDDEFSDEELYEYLENSIDPPEPRLIRNPKHAEQNARDWMEYWGWSDARVTPDGPDGGVDVESSEAIAQVKMEGKPIGRPPLQALYGLGIHQKKTALFFSLSGYTSQAIEWADEVDMPLFAFDFQGTPRAANFAAESFETQEE
jgi:tetratricopeptide (TPR) repeat protein